MDYVKIGQFVEAQLDFKVSKQEAQILVCVAAIAMALKMAEEEHIDAKEIRTTVNPSLATIGQILGEGGRAAIILSATKEAIAQVHREFEAFAQSKA